jgi:hypothetical protein
MGGAAARRGSNAATQQHVLHTLKHTLQTHTHTHTHARHQPHTTPAGEYVEALGPFLQHQGVEACCALLAAWRGNGVLLNEALQVPLLACGAS